jgi:hypothetical protein
MTSRRCAFPALELYAAVLLASGLFVAGISGQSTGKTYYLDSITIAAHLNRANVLSPGNEL